MILLIQRSAKVGAPGFVTSITAVQGSAKRHGCLLSYSQAEPGRELMQPSPRLLAEPCRFPIDMRPKDAQDKPPMYYHERVHAALAKSSPCLLLIRIVGHFNMKRF